MLFDIHYETITPESAEHGDVEAQGTIAEGVTLRDAYQRLRYSYSYCEANEYPVKAPTWLTFYDVEENMATGSRTNWSVHFPPTLTPSTRRRIAKLFRCYGT